MQIQSLLRRLLSPPFVLALLMTLFTGAFMVSDADAGRRHRWKHHRNVRYVHRPVYVNHVHYVRPRRWYRPARYAYSRWYREPGWSFSISYSSDPRARYSYSDPWYW